MQVIRELKKDTIKASSLALGVFDGVHTGHRTVISQAVGIARKMGITAGVVTFSCHPMQVISGAVPGMITTPEEKLRLFEALGVDTTVIINFDENFARMTANEYLKNILQECLNVKSLSVGYNHKFGSDRKGAGDFLAGYCSENGIIANIMSPVQIKGHTVSSSVIRGFITAGDMVSAGEFLGRPFSLRGKVIEGQHLGRKLGFPTANLLVDDELITPLRGVYSGAASLYGQTYASVINVGRRPTVGSLEKDLIEAHLLDFDADIYGEELEIRFLERIRDEKKFDSLDELKKQIEIDCQKVKVCQK